MSRTVHMPRSRAATCFLAFEGAWSLLHALAFTLALLFQVQVAHLSPFELIMLGTAMEAACFLFEIPTGVVADLYSRRLSALVGATIVGIAILAQGLWPSFWPLLAAQVLWGLGYTFVSGALEAWVTDEVGDEAVQPLFTRAHQQHLALTVAGTVLAGVIGHVDLRLPFLLAGVGYLVLVLCIAPFMPETGFARTPRGERDDLAHMRATLRAGARAARGSRVVGILIVVAVLTGLSSEVFDRLWTARVVEAFTLPEVGGLGDPATWFTGFRLLGTLLALTVSLAVNRWARGLVSSDHPTRLLAVLTLVQAVGIAAFALSPSLWPAMVAMWLRDSARAVVSPVQAAWLNRNLDPGTRATVLSMVSQADAVGQSVGGPPLGLLATRTSIPVALLASSALLVPAALAFRRAAAPAPEPAPLVDARR